jgi:hypothetical protein
MGRAVRRLFGEECASVKDVSRRMHPKPFHNLSSCDQSYILFISYSYGEIKGIEEETQGRVPKWEERPSTGSLVTV